MHTRRAWSSVGVCGWPAPWAGLLAAPKKSQPEEQGQLGRILRLHLKRLINTPHANAMSKTVTQ